MLTLWLDFASSGTREYICGGDLLLLTRFASSPTTPTGSRAFQCASKDSNGFKPRNSLKIRELKKTYHMFWQGAKGF
jgi:hypothetical protein